MNRTVTNTLDRFWGPWRLAMALRTRAFVATDHSPVMKTRNDHGGDKLRTFFMGVASPCRSEAIPSHGSRLSDARRRGRFRTEY